MIEDIGMGYYSSAYFKKPGELFREENRLRKVLRILAKFNNGILLDLGCGNGGITAFLREKTKLSDFYGVEISAEGVSLAREKGIKAFEVDIGTSKLPFENSFFDVVFCGEVIEHLFNTDFILDETHRVLKPNGLLVLTTPNLGAWYNRFALLFGFQPSISVSLQNPELGKPFEKAFKKQSAGGSEAHIRFFTRRALESLIRIHGFEILRTQSSYYAAPKNQHSIQNTMYLFDRLFAHFPSWGTDLVVEARKQSIARTTWKETSYQVSRWEDP